MLKVRRRRKGGEDGTGSDDQSFGGRSNPSSELGAIWRAESTPKLALGPVVCRAYELSAGLRPAQRLRLLNKDAMDCGFHTENVVVWLTP
jgi:hypothetical protein